MDDEAKSCAAEEVQELGDPQCIFMQDDEGSADPESGSVAIPQSAKEQFDVDIVDWIGKNLDDIPEEILHTILTNYPAIDDNYKFPRQFAGTKTTKEKNGSVSEKAV